MREQEPEPTQIFACRLPAAPEASPLARTVVDGLDWLDLPEQRHFDLRLLVSEVVSNAVLHGERGDPDQWIGMTVSASRDWVRVQVSDSGPGFRPRPLSDAGRGLVLVQTLADGWGVRRRERRTEVWFEFSLAPAEEQRAGRSARGGSAA